jgi:primase-polymerase (primpol)-like protein
MKAHRIPDTIPVQPQHIPEELKAGERFVCWKWTLRAGKWTKPPINARDGQGDDTSVNASVTDPGTWTTFAEAYDTYRDAGLHGVGRVLLEEDGYVGIDLDHCIDDQVDGIGEDAVAPWALAIVRRFNSYTEVSPSGTGLRIFIRGTLPPGGRRKGQIEVYNSGRYLTLTGCQLFDAATIEDRADELAAWHDEVFGQPKDAPAIAVTPGTDPLTDDDATLIERIRQSRQGPKFISLFDHGDTSAYGGNASDADAALCSILRFWTQADPGRIDRMVRQSALYRPKWDERRGEMSYGQRTIIFALPGTIYQPHVHQQPEDVPDVLDPEIMPADVGGNDTPVVTWEAFERLADELRAERARVAERDATIAERDAVIEDQRAIIQGVTQVLESDLTPEAKTVELRLAFTQHGALSRVRAAGADPTERLVDMVVTLEPFAKRIGVSGDTAQKVVAAATEQGTAFKKRPIVLRANPWTNDPYETPHTFVAIIPQHERLADTLQDIATNRPEALIRKTRVVKPKPAADVIDVPQPEPPECSTHSGSAVTEQIERAIVSRCVACAEPTQAVLMVDGAVFTATTARSGRGDLPSPVSNGTYTAARSGRGEPLETRWCAEHRGKTPHQRVAGGHWECTWLHHAGVLAAGGGDG